MASVILDLPKPKKVPSLLTGEHQSIIDANINTLKNAGYSHPRAVKTALLHVKKMGAPIRMVPHTPRISLI